MAFALSVGLFAYFWVVGYAVVAALHTQRDLIRNALIAPGVGVAVTVYSIYVPSRLGLPVGSFAVIHAVAIVILACVILAFFKPVLPARRLSPYILIGIIAFLATGWPLLTLGFTWLGSLNADMVNYVLDAHRLVDQAFIQSPDPKVWVERSDLSTYFVDFPLRGVRTASDLLLAWVITLTGKNGLMVYMPLLIALNVALIAAATALITTPHRYARLVTAALMSASAMLALGVYLQLFAQVLGLLLLAVAAGLCLTRFYRLKLGNLVWHVVLAALVVATFVLSYPEMLPFFGGALMIYHATDSIEIYRSLRTALTAFFAIAMTSIVLIGPDIVKYGFFLFEQITEAGTTSRTAEIFPFFLIPSGLAALWGISPYVVSPDSSLDVEIAVGAGLCLASILSILWLAKRHEPAPAIAAVMAIVAVPLFLGDSGFGLLKLAMYAQPFLLSTIILATLVLLRASR
jgi:hypothetical protein